MNDFDFEEWADLYKKSPSEYEAKRNAFLKQEIEKVPVKSRLQLRNLQSQCNAIHSTMNGKDATQEMLAMLSRKLEELATALESLNKTIQSK